MNQHYYIDNNDPNDDWRKTLWDAATITFLFILGVTLCALVSSCTTQKVIEHTDTLIVSHYDTVRTTEVKESKVTQYVDRWRDNLYVVNPLTGDTTKQIQKEYCNVYYSKEQHDSIDHYKAMCDSLKRIMLKEVTKEKPLNWWDRFKIDTYMYIFISLLATMITWIVSFYLYRRNKRP
ncbi:MAG: hypothetical protein KBT34_05395 [Prevotella sp.]|nr:hypothetical protein [Candidatus Prevotella equi]